MKIFRNVFKKQTSDRPEVAAPNQNYYRNMNAYRTPAHGNPSHDRAYLNPAACHDLPIPLDTDYSPESAQRTSLSSAEGSYRQQRNTGQQQFHPQSHQQPQWQRVNAGEQQLHPQSHQQAYQPFRPRSYQVSPDPSPQQSNQPTYQPFRPRSNQVSPEQSPQQSHQQTQRQGDIQDTSETDRYLLELEVAKLRSINDAKEQEMRQLEEIRKSEARHLREQEKKRADEEARRRNDNGQVEVFKLKQMERVVAEKRLLIREEREHEIALAEQRERTTLTDRIIMFVLPKAGIFILLLCVLGIVFANPFLGAVLIGVCATVGGAVWMNKDRVDAMERLQISNNSIVVEAWKSKRIDSQTAERAFLTPARRDAVGLRQIEAATPPAWEIK